MLISNTAQGSIPLGETQDKTSNPNVIGPIDIDSFSFGVTNTTNIGSASAGAGAGKAKFSTLTLTRTPDETSPLFYEALGAGKAYPRVVLALYHRSGAHPAQPYLTFDLRLVAISALSESVTSGKAVETLTLQFGSAEITYTPTTANGALGAPVAEGWNQVTNTSSTSIPGLQ
jgi:type VI secretion system secreted protein Hcp